VLSTLRRLLEPPGVPPASVLIADRQTIGLNADAISCDASEFEQLLRRGVIAQALECYRGDLLPGFLDEWVEDERTRLSALHARALVRGDAAIDNARPRETARDDAQRATGAESARELRNLPSYVSVFFDRDDEKRHILGALAEHRLITLAGLGGFGKTRLAVESARAAEGFDPIAFVPLAECGEAGLIADCIRDALRMEATQESALAQLCAFLSEREVLLVLDNFEQLVDDGTRVVLDLLERLPRLRCLVTSRRVLDVPGEHVLTIDPLPVPEPSMDAAEAVATPSLALFIDRARGTRADFALTDDNRATLIELMRALEGLPLAIEIAASRIRTYSPPEMRDALAERFDLLTRQGQRGTRYGRHASMQATIEWSWNLLSDAQQRFWNVPLYLAAVTVGELRRGVERIRHRGDLRQANRLDRWLDAVLTDYSENVLPFDADAAQVWGRLRVPYPENPLDKQIAATALLYDLIVVTRNTRHFACTGAKLFDPFAAM
jgi:predicted nucleic acid-binding protein